MKMLRTLLPWLALVLSVFAIHSVTNAQSDRQLRANSAHIDKIQFRGGYLDNSADQPGRWFEKKNDGTINYEFFKTGFDGNILTLEGPQQTVRLRVDLGAKSISGEWPGHAMAKIYTITDVEFYAAPPVTSAPPKPTTPPALGPTPPAPSSEIVIGHPPLVGAPAPGAAPTPTQTPTPAPTAAPAPQPTATPQFNPPPSVTGSPYGPSPAAPSPAELTYAAHSKGAFERISERAWREVVTDGPAYHFTAIGYDETSLFLHDPLRDVLIDLQPANSLARVSVAGEAMRDVFKLTELRPNQTRPPVPDGTLSPAERAKCADRGGFVERAGLRGAERCTIRFEDGGQSCSDSSQCQGQCRADVGAPNGAAVSGVCQKTDNPFGCYSEVTEGRAGPGLCVD